MPSRGYPFSTNGVIISKSSSENFLPLIWIKYLCIITFICWCYRLYLRQRERNMNFFFFTSCLLYVCDKHSVICRLITKNQCFACEMTVYLSICGNMQLGSKINGTKSWKISFYYAGTSFFKTFDFLGLLDVFLMRKQKKK